MTTEKIKSWPPPRFSAPLVAGEDGLPKHSDGYALLKLVDVAYRLPNGKPIVLEYWQRALVISVLEKFPPGHRLAGQLRYAQAFISMGRQNGKSVLGAIFAMYGLMREKGGLVIGIASNADQAGIVYKRVLTSLKGHPSLAKRFKRTTETRGIESNDGSRYMVKASKSAAVQGLDVTVGILDEVHIMDRELWGDMLAGLGGRANGIIIGITTAGDADSELLQDLYQKAEADEAGEMFGHFIWEAPDNDLPADDETYARYLMLANPSIAEGRRDIIKEIEVIRTRHVDDQRRYHMNRFVNATSAFLRLDQWDALRGDVPSLTRPVVAVSASPEKSHATVTLSQMIDGVTYTEVVASLVEPRTSDLRKVCEDLYSLSPACYVINRNTLPALAKELENAGYPVRWAGTGDMTQASSHLYALVANKRLVHDGNALLYNQIPRAMRRNVGDAFRISATDSSAEIDALYSTAFGCLYAEIEQEEIVSLFF